jgi:hypothetical protein
VEGDGGGEEGGVKFIEWFQTVSCSDSIFQIRHVLHRTLLYSIQVIKQTSSTHEDRFTLLTPSEYASFQERT